MRLQEDMLSEVRQLSRRVSEIRQLREKVLEKTKNVDRNQLIRKAVEKKKHREEWISKGRERRYYFPDVNLLLLSMLCSLLLITVFAVINNCYSNSSDSSDVAGKKSDEVRLSPVYAKDYRSASRYVRNVLKDFRSGGEFGITDKWSDYSSPEMRYYGELALRRLSRDEHFKVVSIFVKNHDRDHYHVRCNCLNSGYKALFTIRRICNEEFSLVAVN